MTQILTPTDRYLADFERLRGAASAQPARLRDLRRRAFERFKEVGFPTARRGNEAWKYTNVGPIAAAEFEYETVHLPGDGGASMSLATAGLSKPETVERHLGRYAAFEDDAFVALNTAFLEDGTLINASRAQVISEPVEVAYANGGADSPTAHHPRTLIVAEPQSRLIVVETYRSDGDSVCFTNAVTEIVLGEGARVDHYRLLLESDKAFHVGNTRVYQGKDSRFTSMTFAAGAAIGRNDFRVLLDAPGAECLLNGLYVTSGTQHIDNSMNIEHAKPHTTSRLYYKGILDGKSRAVFGGLVLVRPGADKTDAYQQDKNLVLSDEAEVDSKPSLEIYADDVKCGHGATAGAVAEDAIFYMRSRGLDEQTANLLLVRGFASEILDTVKIEPLRVFLEERVMEALPRFKTETVHGS